MPLRLYHFGGLRSRSLGFRLWGLAAEAWGTHQVDFRYEKGYIWEFIGDPVWGVLIIRSLLFRVLY